MNLMIPASTSLISQIISAAIAKMNRSGFFDYQTAKECAKVAGMKISEVTDAQLHLLHCVKFAEMPPAVINFLNDFLSALTA